MVELDMTKLPHIEMRRTGRWSYEYWVYLWLDPNDRSRGLAKWGVSHMAGFGSAYFVFGPLWFARWRANKKKGDLELRQRYREHRMIF